MNESQVQTEQGPARDERDDMGILLVHGIGLQRPGDTLTLAGGALFDWLSRWFGPGGAAGQSVILEGTSLAADHRSTGSAYARLRVATGRDSKSSWRLQESYWADAFYPPTLLDLIIWSARMLLWLPLMYLMPRWALAWQMIQDSARARRDASQKVGRVPQAPTHGEQDRAAIHLYLLLAQLPILGLLGPLLVVAMLVILVCSLIPLDSFKSIAQGMQRGLSRSIGDSYFFVTRPLVRSAIETRVEEDIRALAARTSSLVIIAHSQGAAIAYQVLLKLYQRHALPDTRVSLVTYGQGIQRLRAMESALREPRRWNSYGLMIYVALSFVYAAVALGFIGALSTGTAISICIVVLICLPGVLAVATKLLYECSDPLPIDWKNLYATHDPVSAGPLKVDGSIGITTLKRAALFAWLAPVAVDFEQKQMPVVNRRSVFSDHTSYWKSSDEFVAMVAEDLLQKSAIPLPATDSRRIAIGRLRRHWRCGFLSEYRAMLAATLIGACLSPAVMKAAYAYVSKLSWVRSLGELLPSWATSSVALVSIVSLAVGAFVCYVVARIGWNAWDRRAMDAYFEESPEFRKKLPVILFATWWAVTLACIAALVHFDGRLAWRAPMTLALAISIAVSAVALARIGLGEGSRKYIREALAAADARPAAA